jgi:NADPH:quinone reductase-like Zn-dependent oxidoreductase
MLTRANVVACDTVLITGASGGVGSGAVQLAKARGAHVIAVAHHSKHDALKQIGADKVIPRGENLLAMLEESSVDVVLDLVGGDQWPELLDVLRNFGRYAVAGAIAGPIVELDLRTLYLKDQCFFGCTELDSGVFARLVALIEREALTPMVAGTYALRELSGAQVVFLAKQFSGKLVIDMAL